MNEMSDEENVRTPSIVIIAEHPGFQVSLQDWLCTCLPACVIMLSGDLEEFIDQGLAQKPDIILLDFGLQPKKNIDVVRQLKVLHPQAAIIAMSDQYHALLQNKVFSAGASAFLQKSRMVLDLVPTIQQYL